VTADSRPSRNAETDQAQIAASAPGGFATGAMLLLIAALWLATRPYQGIVDDARFYMVEALREIQPDGFASDLYFHFGSQNKFTIFSKLYVPFVTWFGIAATGMGFTILGQFLWLGGLINLARIVLRDRGVALVGVAAVVALPGTYPLFGFGYGEHFVTPRLFTEALTLIALGLLLRRRTVWALAILVLSLAFHPLMALPGIALALLYLALERPLWWFAIIGASVAALGLAFTGVQPFATLRIAYDPQWLEIVRVRDWMCFVLEWPANAYFRAAATVALAASALVLAEPRQRRFLACALIVGIGGIACTLLGGDVANNVLIVQLQLWRAMWILTLAANLYAAVIFLRLRALPGADLTRLAFGVGLGALVLTQFMAPMVYAAGPITVCACGLAVWQLKTGKPLGPAARLACLAALALGVVAIVILGFAYVVVMKAMIDSLSSTLTHFALALGVVGLMLLLEGKATAAASPGLWPVAVSLVLAVVALFYWDARSPWTKFAEASPSPPASLAAFLPDRANVYWEGGLEVLWFRERRPNYYSCDQGTGALFFRGTALAYRARAETLWPLRTIDFGSSLCPNLSDDAKPQRTRADLAAACARDPELDDLILTRPVEGADAKIWDSPVPFQDTVIIPGTVISQRTDRFYLYDCAAFR
jgi:hypothetical protein